MEIEWIYLNIIIKAIYSKPTANIICNSKKLKEFPLRSGASQRCPLSIPLFSIVLEVLAMAVRQEKGIQIEKKKCKRQCLQMAWYIHRYIHAKDITRKPLELINFGKIVGYKGNTHKSFVFLYISNKRSKIEIKENPIYHCNKKNKIPRNKLS